jgi:hypothetical protein
MLAMILMSPRASITLIEINGRVMACISEKLFLVSSLPELAGAGVIAIAGTPTVVLSVGGYLGCGIADWGDRMSELAQGVLRAAR